MSKEDFHYRKKMWLFLSDLFDEDDGDMVFMWLFSNDDREAAEDQHGHYWSGYYKGVADDDE